MTSGTARKASQRHNRTIILPIEQEKYRPIVSAPQQFRVWIDHNYRLHPEIFPDHFNGNYKLHDDSTSEKTEVRTRRIKLRNGEVWTVHPNSVMPYMTGSTDEAAKALYLRQWGIPYEGLVYVFGRDPNYWYRMETQFGRKSIVATTVKTAEIVLIRCFLHAWLRIRDCGKKLAIFFELGE